MADSLKETQQAVQVNLLPLSTLSHILHIVNAGSTVEQSKLRQEVLAFVKRQNLSIEAISKLYSSGEEIFKSLGISLPFLKLKSTNVRSTIVSGVFNQQMKQTLGIGLTETAEILEIIDTQFNQENLNYKSLFDVVLYLNGKIGNAILYHQILQIARSELMANFPNPKLLEIFEKLLKLDKYYLTNILVFLGNIEKDSLNISSILDFPEEISILIKNILKFFNKSLISDELWSTLDRFDNVKTQAEDIIEKHFNTIAEVENPSTHKIMEVLMQIANEFVVKRIKDADLENAMNLIKAKVGNQLNVEVLNGLKKFIKDGIVEKSKIEDKFLKEA